MSVTQGNTRVMSKHRLESLSEGVYAIAMTIMVLDLKIPHTVFMQSGQLWAMLASQISTFVSFAVSFVLLGTFWVIHNKQMRHVRGVDSAFLWLNLLSLFFICLVPYTTSLERVDVQDHVSQALLAANLFALGVANAGAWFYASCRDDILGDTLSREEVRHILRLNLLVPMASCVAFVLAFFAPDYSGYSYLLIIPFKHWLARETDDDEQPGGAQDKQQE